MEIICKFYLFPCKVCVVFELFVCELSLHCNVGIVDFLYFSAWHKVTLKCSWFLTKCVSLDGLIRTRSLLVGCVVHFIANLRLLSSLLVCNDSSPSISMAAVYFSKLFFIHYTQALRNLINLFIYLRYKTYIVCYKFCNIACIAGTCSLTSFTVFFFMFYTYNVILVRFLYFFSRKISKLQF